MFSVTPQAETRITSLVDRCECFGGGYMPSVDTRPKFTDEGAAIKAVYQNIEPFRDMDILSAV